MVIVLAIGPKVREFKPGRCGGLLRAIISAVRFRSVGK
jgi:hypothetical protein